MGAAPPGASSRARWLTLSCSGGCMARLGAWPDGIDDLWHALELVQGHPFGDLPRPQLGSPGGYLWLTDANVRLEHEYAAMIVDTAHTVAGYYFGIDQPQMAARGGPHCVAQRHV
jgi:hypothetical protein